METGQYQQPIEEERYLTALNSRRLIPKELSGAVLPNGGGNGGGDDDDDKREPHLELLIRTSSPSKKGEYGNKVFDVKKIMKEYFPTQQEPKYIS